MAASQQLQDNGDEEDFFYTMKANPKGLCVIINNRNFGDILPERRGTDKDKDGLFEIFSCLKFSVKVHENLDDEAIINVMKEVSSQDHSQHDCLVVCVLSHGCKGSVIGTNGEKVLIKDLIYCVKPQMCRTLAGKPKLFFIQACQGTDAQTVHPSMERDVMTVGEEEMIPNDSDILLAYSTVPGYQSYRDCNLGSVYIKCLINCLHKYARTKDILDILTKVNNEVSKEMIRVDDTKTLCQCPNPRYTLRKKVLLGSGVQESELPEGISSLDNLHLAEGDAVGKIQFQQRTEESASPSDNRMLARPASVELSTCRQRVLYQVMVFATSVSGRFVLQLFGIRGTTDEQELKDGDSEDSRCTKFEMWLLDVAPLKMMRVAYLSNKGKNKVLLEKIELKNMTTRTVTVFQCNKQLGMDSVNLGARERDKELVKETDYKITVETSSVRGAGTDANVFMILFGSNGESQVLHLEKSETHKDPFEKGHTDIFRVCKILNLGELYKLRIWHDNKNFGAAWHLAKIEVKDTTTERAYTFKCDRWLSEKDGEKQIIRELTCSSERGPENVVYEIEVRTADEENSGTFHSIWLRLKGSKSESDMILQNNTPQHRILQRGQIDNFTHTSPSYGTLERCTIGCFENKEQHVQAVPGAPDDWQCYDVFVTDTSTGTRTRFHCQSWLSPKTHLGPNSGVECPKVQTDDTFWARIKKRGPVMYKVDVLTGDIAGAGTNANVFITIASNNGDTGKRPLKKTGKDLFEQGQKDTFMLEAVDLGNLTSIRVEHDNSGLKSDWFLERIEVTNTKTNCTTIFPCQKWLKAEPGNEPRNTSLILHPERPCLPKE